MSGYTKMKFAIARQVIPVQHASPSLIQQQWLGVSKWDQQWFLTNPCCGLTTPDKSSITITLFKMGLLFKLQSFIFSSVSRISLLFRVQLWKAQGGESRNSSSSSSGTPSQNRGISHNNEARNSENTMKLRSWGGGASAKQLAEAATVYSPKIY